MVTITLKEKDSSGKEIVSQTTVPQYTEFVFPECKNAPDGYEFVCWKQVYSDGYTSIYSYAPGDTESSLEATYEAIYLPLAETAYIAADGTEQTVRAKVLDDSYEGLHLNNGWYVLAGNYTYYEPITIDGSVKLIVPDGITFSTVGDNMRILYGNRKTSAIAVFGQREQTGTLDFGSRDFSCPAIKVYGGHINCQATTSFGGVYGTEIARGTIGWRGGLSVPKAGVTISGGNLNFSGQTILTGELQLGWTKLTDSVRFASIRIIDNPKNHGSIVIADNQAFKDEAGNIYTGALTDDQISAIQGKTLTPCLLHNYGEPEWNWSNEYKDASATFKCVDAGCGYEQTVSAKVTYRDEGDYRIASASCQFNGETYTIERTARIIFDVNVENNAAGTITVSDTKAKSGNKVKVSLTPNNGYFAKSFTVTADDDARVIESDNKSFIMPEGNVTVKAEFGEITPMVEPYIDANGAYHLGTVAYAEIDGEPYAVNEDGTIGDLLDSVELSYFNFELLDDDTYRINRYTGPTDTLSELVIPKTFNGKQITVLGNSSSTPLIDYAGKAKTQFELTLTENIREIKGYAFYTMWVKQVKGDSSGLNKLGDYAFSWANSPNNYMLDIKLDHEGTVTVGKGIFNNMTVTARIRHATKLSSGSFMQKSISYILTDDAHTYGQPKWTWSDDHGTATAKFTCTDSRCRHEETVEATVTSATKDGVITYTATAELDGETYTDIKTAFSDGVGARVIGHTISLDGDIAVNFYMELDPEIAQSKTAYMQFTIPDTSKEYQEQTVKVCEAEKKDGYYIFKCRVAAKDMETPITAQIIYGDRQGTPYTYSVKQYADYLVEHQDDSTIFKNAVPLVQAMIAYGENAKWYFGKTDEDPDKINIEIPEYKSTVYDLPEGVTFGGATLSLKSETTLSLYFNSETEPTLTCADLGVSYETGKTGTNEYVIRIRGIAANDLNKPFTVNVNGTKAVEYSALTYCFKAQNNSNPKLVNTVKALYQYWQQADLYFRNQEGN